MTIAEVTRTRTAWIKIPLNLFFCESIAGVCRGKSAKRCAA
ncbi:hypothetical protein DRQ26_03085 [bacterium]|nr:MAG: hypothetical protein DRQ26_03085 [bacterium]